MLQFYNQIIVMCLEPCPHLFYIFHLETAFISFKRLNSICKHQFSKLPVMHNLAQFINLSSHHKFIRFQILPLLLNMIIQKYQFFHDNFGKQKVEIVLDIVFHKNLEFKFDVFFTSKLIISKANAFLIVLKHNFHLGDLAQPKSTPSILKLHLCVSYFANCINLFVFIIYNATQLQLTEPVTLSHILLLLLQGRRSYLQFPLLEH